MNILENEVDENKTYSNSGRKNIEIDVQQIDAHDIATLGSPSV